MFRNILVAIDGSPDAEEALAQAFDLAASEHGRLTIFTAIAEPSAYVYATPTAAATLAILSEHADEEAATLVRDARERAPEGISVTTVVKPGPAKAALLAQLEAGEHDLVVMGSRGRGAVRSALLGSVSHHVLHHTRVPVLIAHGEGEGEGDGGEPAAPAPGGQPG